MLLESVGGGAASLDFDRDGGEDLFVSGGGSLPKEDNAKFASVLGQPSGLFRNANRRFRNISSHAGLVTEDLYTHGCNVCDFDSDGFDDLVVAGFAGLQLWRNQGDGRFQETSRAVGLVSPAWNVTPAAADFDQDGLVDLYIVTYADWSPDRDQVCQNDQGFRDVCGPTRFAGTRDVLFRNTGAGFEDVTEVVGLVPANRGLGVVAADFNRDGFTDVAVVNDVQENQLYLNGGSGTFREEAQLWGCAYSITGEREGSMGVEASDFDRDGLPDLWYTNYVQQDNSLLRNVDGSGFAHVTARVGMSGASRPWVGFGTLLADFDGDNWDDVFIANGHVAYEWRESPYYQPPQMFRGEQGKKFVEVSASTGTYFQERWSGRGAIRTDWNEDGAWDIVVVHQNDPVALLENRRAPDSWIKVDLVGTACHRNATGAEVVFQIGEQRIHRFKVGGGSYCSHSDRRLGVALEEAVGSLDVTVRWPGGGDETFEDLSSRRTHVLIEGRGVHVAQ